MTALAEPGSPVYADRDRDPLGPVLALGESGLPIGVALGLIGALLVHGLAAYKMASTLFEVATFAQNVRMLVLERQQASIDIDVAKEGTDLYNRYKFQSATSAVSAHQRIIFYGS